MGGEGRSRLDPASVGSGVDPDLNVEAISRGGIGSPFPCCRLHLSYLQSQVLTPTSADVSACRRAGLSGCPIAGLSGVMRR